MKRIPGIFLALLCALALTQCVSPLDPDTPRVYTPGPDPVRADPVKVRFRMNGALLRNPGQARIQDWPTLAMTPVIEKCEVDTAQNPNRFTIRTQYSKTIDIDSLEFHSENLHIYGVKFQIDSLPLPTGNESVLLDNSASVRRNFVELQVVYTKANAAGDKKREFVSSHDNGENNDVVMSECLIAFVKYDEREKRFHLRLDCVLTWMSAQSKFRYSGEIILNVVP